MTPTDVLAAARTWIGTPYHHQASMKGVGCDCLGLVRGVYTELYGHPPEDPPAYTRDLAEASGRETLLEAARRHLVEIAPADVAAFAADRDQKRHSSGRDQQDIAPSVAAGDVVIFRLRPGAMAKHCGILSASAAGTPAKIIHAFEGAPICEVTLSSWWRRRITAAFTWPRRI